MVHENHAPAAMLTAVHRCTVPSENASAGNTSIVHPLLLDELALSADVKVLILLPART